MADASAVAKGAHAQVRALGSYPQPLEEPLERLIVPTKRRVRLRDIVRHRNVIRVLAARDFKARYKQAVMGPVWLFVQPLVMLLAFLVAFRGLGHVRSSGQPYVVFVLVGLTAWAFFSSSVSMGTGSLAANGNFIRFTPVPRVAFPVAGIISSAPAFLITATAMIVAAIVDGALSPRVMLLPFGLAWLMLLIAGVVAMLSSVTVRYRDITGVLPFILGIGVFFVPVGYSLSGLSSHIRVLVELNPLSGIIESWRWMVLPGYSPRILPIVLAMALTVGILIIGWRVFTRLEPFMADVI